MTATRPRENFVKAITQIASCRHGDAARTNLDLSRYLEAAWTNNVWLATGYELEIAGDADRPTDGRRQMKR